MSLKPENFPEGEVYAITPVGNEILSESFEKRSYLTYDFYTFDFSKEAYALNIPLRLIHRRQDPVGEGVPVLLNERMKNSKLTFIEKCGHFPWIDQPTEFFKVLRESLIN